MAAPAYPADRKRFKINEFKIRDEISTKNDFFGWVLRTPAKEVITKVENEDGELIEETHWEGGRILLASLTPFSNGDTILKDMNFYVTK